MTTKSNSKFHPKTMLKDSVKAGARSAIYSAAISKTYQAVLNGDSGTLDAVVKIQVSNNKIDWIDALKVTLNAVDPELSDTDGLHLPHINEWTFVSALVVSISGAGAKVSVYAGSRYDD